MEKFLWDGRGGRILDAYSQKVEKRKLGIMGGFHGVLRWSDGGEEGEDELFEFLLLHHEESTGLGTFSIQQSISVHLKAWAGGHLSPSAMKILQTLDEEFTRSIPNIFRSLPCRQCMRNGHYDGHFPLKKGILLGSTTGYCCYQRLNDSAIGELHLTEGGRKSYIQQVVSRVYPLYHTTKKTFVYSYQLFELNSGATNSKRCHCVLKGTFVRSSD